MEPNRLSHRLHGYNYSGNGAYFITIVCQNRIHRFGSVIADEIVLNDAGRMVCSVWEAIPQFFPMIELDRFIIMPNHIHGIIVNHGEICRGRPCVRPGFNENAYPEVKTDKSTNIHSTVGDVICAFKSITTNRYSRGVKMGLVPPFQKRLWQRDYWDHIIRNESEYHKIQEYIINNPQSWELDQYR